MAAQHLARCGRWLIIVCGLAALARPGGSAASPTHTHDHTHLAATGAGDALLHSWRINLTGQLGTYTLAGGQTGTNPADVQLTQQNASNVYVHAAGIPTYNIGPFAANPNVPNEQNYRFRLPKAPAVESGARLATALGHIAVLVNGVPVYNALDAFSWNTTLQQDLPTNGPPQQQRGSGIWNRNAIVAEAASFDSCLGHPAGGGRYHNHQNPSCLRGLLGDDGGAHSPIIGWAFDGYPIYGPYGYSDPLDASSPVERLASSYRLRSITQRTTLADGTVLSADQYGPAVSASYPLGYYVEDFEYAAGSGDLDAHNGRTMVTPEYLAGTYAYVMTLNADGSAAYPYFIGPRYYGVVATDNLGAGQVTIPADAQTVAPQRLYLPFGIK